MADQDDDDNFFNVRHEGAFHDECLHNPDYIELFYSELTTKEARRLISWSAYLEKQDNFEQSRSALLDAVHCLKTCKLSESDECQEVVDQIFKHIREITQIIDGKAAAAAALAMQKAAALGSESLGDAAPLSPRGSAGSNAQLQQAGNRNSNRNISTKSVNNNNNNHNNNSNGANCNINKYKSEDMDGYDDFDDFAISVIMPEKAKPKPTSSSTSSSKNPIDISGSGARSIGTNNNINNNNDEPIVMIPNHHRITKDKKKYDQYLKQIQQQFPQKLSFHNNNNSNNSSPNKNVFMPRSISLSNMARMLNPMTYVEYIIPSGNNNSNSNSNRNINSTRPSSPAVSTITNTTTTTTTPSTTPNAGAASSNTASSASWGGAAGGAYNNNNNNKSNSSHMSDDNTASSAITTQEENDDSELLDRDDTDNDHDDDTITDTDGDEAPSTYFKQTPPPPAAAPTPTPTAAAAAAASARPRATSVAKAAPAPAAPAPIPTPGGIGIGGGGGGGGGLFSDRQCESSLNMLLNYIEHTSQVSLSALEDSLEAYMPMKDSLLQYLREKPKSGYQIYEALLKKVNAATTASSPSEREHTLEVFQEFLELSDIARKLLVLKNLAGESLDHINKAYMAQFEKRLAETNEFIRNEYTLKLSKHEVQLISDLDLLITRQVQNRLVQLRVSFVESLKPKENSDDDDDDDEHDNANIKSSNQPEFDLEQDAPLFLYSLLTCLKLWVNIRHQLKFADGARDEYDEEDHQDNKGRDPNEICAVMIKEWLGEYVQKAYVVQKEQFRLKLVRDEEDLHRSPEFDKKNALSVLGYQITNLCSWCLEDAEELSALFSDTLESFEVCFDDIIFAEYSYALTEDLLKLSDECQRAPVSSVPLSLFHSLCPVVKEAFDKLYARSDRVRQFNFFGGFHRSIQRALENTAMVFDSWADNALKIDKWEPLNEDDGDLHSSSCVDTLSALDQSLTLVKKLEVMLIVEPDVDTGDANSSRSFLLYFITQIAPIMVRYPGEMRDICVASLSKSFEVVDPASPDVVKLADTPHLRKACICLNNIHQFRRQLDDFLTELGNVNESIDIFETEAAKSMFASISKFGDASAQRFAKAIFLNSESELKAIFTNVSTALAASSTSANKTGGASQRSPSAAAGHIEDLIEESVNDLVHSLDQSFQLISGYLYEEVLHFVLRNAFNEIVKALADKLITMNKAFTTTSAGNKAFAAEELAQTKSAIMSCLKHLRDLFHADGNGIRTSYLDKIAEPLVMMLKSSPQTISTSSSSSSDGNMSSKATTPSSKDAGGPDLASMLTFGLVKKK